MQPPPSQKLAADGDAVDRFARDLAALAGPDWLARRFGVAVSGGPDSMALLWLAASLLPGQVHAATVDHGLRQGSADEARMVAAFCAREHIPHVILQPAQPIRGSLQAAARAVRYRLLDEWRTAAAIDHVLTAHHADDQLETMVMRLNRASGVGGLAAIRARNGAVLRPLLRWRRGELAALALDNDLPFVDDPANGDHRFDRARLRQALAGQSVLDPVAVARSAQWLGDADDALNWAVAAVTANWPDAADISVIRDEAYPAEIFRRVVETRLRANEPGMTLRGAALDGVVAAMQDGRRAMVGGLMIDPMPAPADGSGAIWRISAAPHRKTGKKA
ncbi:MAG: tRNA lysidine(34) synthetase TilS [Sphingopyxis macrogoltabida]|uniref:tRNA(Ile)-lysidine synthase n=1 Tax=Sphingopyxis macrogoltabida TaxID=33050 RepID=A0A2W5L273_SPHMC|nr:MAG: tRNA lysidine(34) synthetase TilS [Sphingopyxis macrogoltabida]